MLKMKLRQARHYLEMTQEDLGKIFGVSKIMVCYWEKGVNKPRKAKREKMKKFFEDKGISLEDI